MLLINDHFFPVLACNRVRLLRPALSQNSSESPVGRPRAFFFSRSQSWVLQPTTPAGCNLRSGRHCDLRHLSLTTDVIEAVVSTSLNTQQLEHEIPVNIKDTLYSDQYSTSISQTKQQGGEYSETNGCSKHSVVHFEHTEQENKYSQ